MAGNGAAIASVISEIIVNGYQLIYLRKIIRIPISWKAILQGIIASAVMGCSVFASMLLFKNSLLRCIVCSVIGGIIYIIVNMMMKNKMIEYGIGIVKNRLNKSNHDGV